MLKELSKRCAFFSHFMKTKSAILPLSSIILSSLSAKSQVLKNNYLAEILKLFKHEKKFPTSQWLSITGLCSSTIGHTLNMETMLVTLLTSHPEISPLKGV